MSFLITVSIAFSPRASFSRPTTKKLFSHHHDSSFPSSSRETPEPIIDRDEHVRILNDNLERHIGKGLRDFTKTICDTDECWDDIHTNTKYALLSHGAINDLDGPVNNYGNFAALGAFEMTWAQLTDIPATRMAKPGLDQEEWSQVLQKVRAMEKDGFLQNYKGFRCTANQSSFFIRDAMVRCAHVLLDPQSNESNRDSHLVRYCRFGIASTTTVNTMGKLSSLTGRIQLLWILHPGRPSR